MTTTRALGRRLDRLQAHLIEAGAALGRLVLLVGPDGPSTDEQARIAQAVQAGRAVMLIELVPGQRTAAAGEH